MAVKTNFAREDFIEILSHYDLGELQDFQPIIKGAVQTTFSLETTGGKFVFRYYESRSFGSVLFESELIQFLNEHRYPCPAIFRSRQGEFVRTYRDKPYILFAFVEGEHIEQPSAHQKSQLIEKVAELQNLTKNFVPPHTQHRWNYSPALCGELAQQAAEKINTPNARAKQAWFEDELTRIDLPDSLPKGICHCDFHFSNILFKDGEFRALIDFDDANYTYLTYDLVTLMNPFIPVFEWDTWSSFRKDDPIFDLTEASQIVAEYMKHRELSKEEQTHLFDVFKLSILFDCIWYFERGDVNDFYERRKIDALNQLGREQFAGQLFVNE